MRDRFKTEAAWMIWNGHESKSTRRLVPAVLHAKARRRLNRVILAERPHDCAIFPGFKMLQGRLRGVYQFEIDRQFRIRFSWENGRAERVEIGDFHDEEQE